MFLIQWDRRSNTVLLSEENQLAGDVYNVSSFARAVDVFFIPPAGKLNERHMSRCHAFSAATICYTTSLHGTILREYLACSVPSPVTYLASRTPPDFRHQLSASRVDKDEDA